MDIRLKNKVINIVTFITHLVISLSFVLSGWFGIAWANSWRTEENLTIYYFIITAGIILFFINFSILFSNSFKFYITILLITLISAITWITVQGSMDLSNRLPAYIIVFTSLAFYKYKLNNNKKNLHHATPNVRKK